MRTQTIRNTLLGLLITGLLTVMAQDALAQRPVLRGERRADENRRPARTSVKKEKILKPSGRQAVQKERASRSVRRGDTIQKQSKRQDVRQKHVPRTVRRSDNILKQSGRKAVRQDRTAQSARPGAAYSGSETRKRHYRDSGKHHNSYKRDGRNAYKHRDKGRRLPAKQNWHRNHYRRPAWVDYHRPGFRYPRIGLRVSVLPRGYFSIKLGDLRFYAYRGVYYRYNPALRVYVVVNKPRIETWYTSGNWDRITLLDGSTIEGVYLYTDDDIVFFEVGDALLEIPMSEIRILSLSDH